MIVNQTYILLFVIEFEIVEHWW